MPISLYWRDPVACLESILHNPLITDHVSMVPFQLFKSVEKLMRVYTEWLSVTGHGIFKYVCA